MKKRVLAVFLAFLMLCSVAAVPAAAVSDSDAAWNRESEYFDGGSIQYGTVELRCDSVLAVLHFAYGYGVSVPESGLQTVAGILADNASPIINLPYDSNQLAQRFFVVTSNDLDSVDALVAALEGKNVPAAPPAEPDAPETEEEAEEEIVPLTDEQVAALMELFGSFGFAGETAASPSDAVSDADVISDTDAVPVRGMLPAAAFLSGSDAVSYADAVSTGDAVSGSDTQELTSEQISSLLAMFGSFGFDSQPASGSDAVSGADAAQQTASASDAVSSGDASSEENVVSEADAPEEEQPEQTVSDADVPEDENKPDADDVAGSVESLLAVRAGINELRALPTLEESLAAAFPAFVFGEAIPVTMTVPASQDITLSADMSSAKLIVRSESEYVDIELNGTVYTVLMLNSKSTECTVDRLSVSGLFGAQPDADENEETTTATETTTTTTTATTTETTTTTTQTTTTTTAATTVTTTTAATTTTTTTTTAPTEDHDPDLGMTGYVSTRSKNLHVRKGPGLGFGVITKIPKGTVVTILERPNDEWYLIRLSDGTEGYVFSYYITINE